MFLLHVATNHRIHAKLLDELDTAASQGLVSSPIRNSEAVKLPYFQACVDEALRRFPPITQLRERVSPPGGDTIDGTYIPGGTNIGLNAWGLQRHQCFGSDPEVFRPERWLEADQERLTEMRKVQGLIFGYGDTKCLGILQASMIINKTLVEVSPCAISTVQERSRLTRPVYSEVRDRGRKSNETLDRSLPWSLVPSRILCQSCGTIEAGSEGDG